MNKINAVCVYCGAHTGSNPIFRNVAIELGKMLAQNNLQMVFGGGWDGLMGVTARAAIEAGGKVKGIIPHFLSHLKELACTEIVITKSMHDRKQMMFDCADAFVALPGGVGTLEELAEQLKWVQLGQHSKPIFVLNASDYWTPFIELLDHMKKSRFIDTEIEAMMRVCSSVAELSAAIEDFNRMQMQPGRIRFTVGD